MHAQEAGLVERPFWTVLIPTYNRTTYLKQCLESVFREDPGRDRMEILVTDDCSPPEVAAAVEQWGGGRVLFRPLKRHQGQWPNVNSGIRAARGEWIHLLNDDDFVLPGFYQAMEMAISMAPASVGVISSPSLLLQQAHARTGPQAPVQPTAGVIQRFLERLAVANPINLASTVVSRKVYATIGNYTPRLPFCSDWDFHTLEGNRWYSRIGSAILRQADLSELVATSVEDYVQRIVGLVLEPERLAEVRRK